MDMVGLGRRCTSLYGMIGEIGEDRLWDRIR